MKYFLYIIFVFTFMSGCGAGNVKRNEPFDRLNRTGSYDSKSTENIRRVMERIKLPAYEEYLKYQTLDKELAGVVIFSFTLSVSGKVEDLTLIDSSLKNNELVAEILKIVQSAKFDTVKEKPQNITYKFNFQPGLHH